jgi:hypothetical protein
MPKTSVSPVIFKIFRIRCCVQTRSSAFGAAGPRSYWFTVFSNWADRMP